MEKKEKKMEPATKWVQPHPNEINHQRVEKNSLVLIKRQDRAYHNPRVDYNPTARVEIYVRESGWNLSLKKPQGRLLPRIVYWNQNGTKQNKTLHSNLLPVLTISLPTENPCPISESAHQRR